MPATMSSPHSDYEQHDSSAESSTDGPFKAGLWSATEPLSSPRKRHRSFTVNSPPNPKRPKRADRLSSKSSNRTFNGEYKDAYRILYNETVSTAATRFVTDDSFQPHAIQLGGVHWSTQEKRIFFAALERLGKDDIPGIAKAIGSKSIPETRAFLLLIQDAIKERHRLPTSLAGLDRAKVNVTQIHHANVTLQDIPAAFEIGLDSERRLELAGDALARFQEVFEAKQEQERYGSHWLITPDITREIRTAFTASRAASLASLRSSPVDNGKEDDVTTNVPDPQILQDIPEAKLLDPYMLLKMSRTIFMNPSPAVLYPWPNWTELTSGVAAEPSIYRTAFNDLHALVISLTRRLVQVAIIQAMSRIRAHGWREKKGVRALVRPRDVLTAVDILGLKRNSRELWRGAARRCGLRILEPTVKMSTRYVCQEKWSREVPWDEVEHTLDFSNTTAEPLDTDANETEPRSRADGESFRSRAARGGTPLPMARPASSGDLEADEGVEEVLEDDSESDIYQPLDDEASDTSDLGIETAQSQHDASEDELQALEDFDQKASRIEEVRLLDLLGVSPPTETDTRLFKTKTEELKAKSLRRISPTIDDWRSWTQYRASWEEHHTPVPLASFLANKKKPSPPAATVNTTKFELDHDYENDDDTSSDRDLANVELPIRSTREFAAMQSRMSISEARDVESDDDEHNTQVLAQSIEDGGDAAAAGDASEDDVYDSDAEMPTH